MNREERIAEWKARNEKPIELEIELEPAVLNEDESVKEEALIVRCQVKKPTLQLIDAVQSNYDDRPNDAGIFLLENCWISGDNIIKEVEELKLSAAAKMFGLFKMKLVEIKKK